MSFLMFLVNLIFVVSIYKYNKLLISILQKLWRHCTQKKSKVSLLLFSSSC